MKNKHIIIVVLLYSFTLPSCGGGGGGGGTNPSVAFYGSIEGYVYAAIGSAPAARIALDAQPGYAPLTGASVTAIAGSSSKSTTTNSSGYFKLSSLLVGSYTVTIAKSGYLSVQNNANVTANTTTRMGGSNGINVPPVSSGSIRVTANVSGIKVSIDGKNTNIAIPSSLSYTFGSISVGNHTVGVDSTGYSPLSDQIVNVTAGNTTQVNFELISPGITPPVADAGDDAKTFIATYYTNNGSIQDYTPHEYTYTLDGSGSYDPDGDTITYSWLQTGGPSITLSSSSAAKPTFTPVTDGTYTFRLIVRDGVNNSSPDYVSIIAKRPSGKLAYWVIDGSDAEIQTMNADGSEFTQITSNTVDDQNPKWSNSGSRIVFQSTPTSSTPQIKIMNSNGSGAFNVTNNAVSNITPSWSCDDSKILFSQADGGMNTNDIFRINIDGTNLVQLTNDSKADLEPIYSNNCSKILYVNGSGSDYDIKIMDADGSDQTDLSNDSITHYFAKWTSNGRILFTESQYLGASVSLFVMNSDGSGKQSWPMPNGMPNVGIPVMSSDGEYLFYADDYNILHVMFANGSADMSYGVYGRCPDYHTGP